MRFWNREENYCLVGDVVANVHSPVMFFQKCRPLEDYKDNLNRFNAKVGEDCQRYTGHNVMALSKEIISEILSLCDDVLAGKTQNDIPYMPPFLQEAPADAGILKKLKMKPIINVVS